MSREIDERVVQMKFESGQFEKNVQGSINSLDELKKGLDFKDAIKGFEKIDGASKSVKLDPLTAAVAQLNSHFNLLGITAFNVMNRISNQAISTGEILIKSLSIDQIGAGWDKYGEKTGAVQTIMAATAKEFTDTGKQMEFVNSQLDKLNWFTDETSYNFVDMVNNIGKFTSNNIALDDSVTAMQGIANWAAISGANANEASRAMYNLSQAMASGSLRLQDWMSIENANMGTAAFKEMAIQSALTAGTLIKNGDKITTANGKVEVSVTKFRDTLSENWLSSEVLLNTLNEYGAATNKLNEVYETYDILTSEIVEGIDEFTAGTKNAEEIAKDWGITVEEAIPILEDFQTETMQFGLKAFKAAQEAKTFRDAIDSVKDAVSTGWMKSFELIFGNYEEAKVLWTNLANELYDIFAESGNARNEMLEAWSEMGGRSYFVDTIYGALSAILSILTPLKVAWNDVFGSITAFDLTVISVRVHDFVQNLTLSNDAMEKVRSTAKGLFSILHIVKTALSAAARAFFDVLSYLLPVGDNLLTVTASFGDFTYTLDKAIQKSRIFDKAFGSIANGIKFAADIIKSAINLITGSFVKLSGDRTMEGYASTIGSIAGTIFNRFSEAGKVVKTVILEIGKALNGSLPNLDKLSSVISSFLSAISNPFSGNGLSKALDMLNAGLFTGFVITLKKLVGNISKLNINGVIGGIKKTLEGLSETLGTLQDRVKSGTLRNISISIAILAASLLLLAAIDSDKMTTALSALTILFTELMASMTAFTKIISGGSSKGIIKLSAVMIAMSSAVLILASSVRVLSDVGWDKIISGLFAVGSLCAIVTVSMKSLTNESKSVIKGAAGLIAFAVSIRILVGAVSSLSDIDFVGLLKGLSGVGALMAEVAVFSNYAGSLKIGSSFAFIALAESIAILSSAVERLAALNTATMLQGLSGVAVLLTEIGLFSKILSKTKGMLSASISLNLIALSLSSLSGTIERMGGIPIGSVVQGLTTLAIALTEIVLSMNLLPKDILKKSIGLFVISSAVTSLSKALSTLGNVNSIAKALVLLGGSLIEISVAMHAMQKGLKGAAALVVFSAALNLLAPAIEKFGSMSLGDIVKSLAALISVFGVIGGAAALLKPLVPSILSLSGSIAIFSASVALLGVGVTLLSTGLAALGVSAIAGVGGLTVALMEIIALIPAIIRSIGEGIIAFANVIADGAPAIANAAVQLVLSALNAVSQTVPEIVGTIVDIIKKVAVEITKRSSDLKDAAKILFGGFSEGVLTGISDILRSMSILIPSIVASMQLLSGVKGSEKGTAKSLASMVAIVAALGLVIIAFSHIPLGDIDNAVSVSLAIATLLPIMVGSFAFLSATKSHIDKKTVESFGVFALIVSAVGLVVALIGKIDGAQNAIAVASSLAILLPSLAATVGMLSMVKGFNAGSLGKIALLASAIDVVIAIVGGLMVGVGALSENFGGFEAALEAAPKAAQLLGDAIGNLIGGIIGGIAGGALAGIASSWPLVCGALSLGMQQLTPFFDTLERIPGGGIELVGTLIGMIVALTAAEFVSGLKALPGIGALLAIGTATLPADFASFGLALKAFGDSLGDTDVGKVKTAAEAVEILATLENNLPAQGGKINDWLFGNKSLTDFGERLKSFGDAIMQFSQSVVGLDPTVVTAAAEAGQALAGLENSLPSTGSVVDKWFFGEKDLGAFGEKLNLFGYGLSLFQGWVRNLDSSIVTNAVNAGQALSELENNLPAQDGALQGWLGSQSLDDFGNRITTFGQALVDFSTTIDGKIKVGAISLAAQAAQKLADLENSLGNTGGLKRVFFGDDSLKNFGKNLDDFGEGLIDLSDAISGIDLNQLNGAIDYIERLVSLENVNEASRAVISAAKTLMQDVHDVISSNAEQFKHDGNDIAKWIVAGFSKGVSDFTGIAVRSAEKLGISIAQAVRDSLEIASPSAVMEEVGMWTVRGLAEGITKDTSAEEAAEKKASNIVSAFQNTLSKISTRREAISLEYQLWSVSEGYGATDAEKSSKELIMKGEDLRLLAQNVQTQQAALTALEKTLGKESEQYQEQANKVMQAKIDMYNAANEINEAQRSQVTDEMSQLRAYAETLKEYSTTFDMLGYSQEQREAYARQKTGYGIEDVKKDLIDTNAIIAGALGEQTVIIEETVAKTTSSAISSGVKNAVSASIPEIEKASNDTGNAIDQGVAKGVSDNQTVVQTACYDALSRVKDWGMEAINANSPSRDGIEIGMWFMRGVENGLTENSISVENVSKNISSGVKQPFDDRIPDYKIIAFRSMEGFTIGIQEKGKMAIAAANQVALQVAEIMAAALQVASPSKVTERIGKFTSMGLALGIRNGALDVQDASENLANTTVDALTQAKTLIGNVLDSDDDFSPTITPVLDLDQLTADSKQIPGLLSRNTRLNVSATARRANALNQSFDSSRQNGSDGSIVTNYNMTQNNYSPKALNRSEIYRQTKNQFSQLKGATRVR